MKSISFLIVFLFTGYAYSMPVFYDTTTLNVDSWGYVETEKYLSDYPNLKMIYVKDDDPILKNRIPYLKYNKLKNKICLKTKAQITAIKNEERKQKIRSEIRALKKQEAEALSDGYDVSVETSAIKQKIDTLKQEYDSIP